MLIIKALNVSYGGDTSAVQNLSLVAESGEMVAITGRSGAGKSTLLNVLAGLVQPQSGSAVLNGQSLLQGEPQATLLRRRMGFVFQNATLFPELSVLDNVRWVGQLRGLTKAEATRKATANLESVGVHHLYDRRPGQISGGEAQRVNIARALTGEIELMLVDEPTAALDTDTSNDVCRILKAVVQDSNVTTLVVSHDPIVTKYCTRAVRMAAGQLFED